MEMRVIREHRTSRYVSLPIKLCRDLGFNPGTHILILTDGVGRIVLQKITPEEFPDLFQVDESEVIFNPNE